MAHKLNLRGKQSTSSRRDLIIIVVSGQIIEVAFPLLDHLPIIISKEKLTKLLNKQRNEINFVLRTLCQETRLTTTRLSRKLPTPSDVLVADGIFPYLYSRSM